jgi:BirA family biotin operon repressor/biotin-[acetyl-CoA-carboxylase] ligase
VSEELQMQRVDEALAGTIFAGREGAGVRHFRTIDSTNTQLVAAAQAGAATGLVFVADEQTVGRGRGGHAWHSEAGAGLYVSALVRPGIRSDDVLKISLAAGLAVQDAVREVAGVGIELRWPNDLMVRGEDGGRARKCGGILTETAMEPGDGALRYAVIGIGLNLNHEAMPEAVASVAASLRMVRGESVDRERMLVEILLRLDAEIRALEGGGDVVPRFEKYSGWARGMRVKVEEEEGYTGETDGLDARGMLRVRLEDGSVRMPRHGGVREIE